MPGNLRIELAAASLFAQLVRFLQDKLGCIMGPNTSSDRPSTARRRTGDSREERCAL